MLGGHWERSEGSQVVLTDADEVAVCVSVGVADGTTVLVGVLVTDIDSALGVGVTVFVAVAAAVCVLVDVAVGLRVAVNGMRVGAAVRKGVDDASPTTVGVTPIAPVNAGGEIVSGVAMEPRAIRVTAWSSEPKATASVASSAACGFFCKAYARAS